MRSTLGSFIVLSSCLACTTAGPSRSAISTPTRAYLTSGSQILRRPDPPGAIEGLSFAPDGAPCSACVVELVTMPGEGYARRQVVEADVRGSFRLSRLPPGRYVVSGTGPATTEECSRPRAPPQIVLVGDTAARVAVRMWETHALPGLVRDQFGRPVPGATVSAGPPWSTGPREARRTATADQDGRFVLCGLYREPYVVSARSHSKCFDDESSSVVADAAVSSPLPHVVPIEVRYQGCLDGHVVDEGGRPLERFSVDNVAVHPRAGEPGRFIVSRFDQAHRIEVAARGFASEEVDLPPPDAHGDVHLGDVVLRRASPLAGRVVDDADGVPVANAQVWLKTAFERRAHVQRVFACGLAADDYDAARPVPVWTDSAGRFVFDSLSPRTRALVITDGAHLTREVDVDALRKDPVVRLSAGARIQGHLVGLPVSVLALVEVVASSVELGSSPVDLRTARPSSGSSFSLSGLAAGQWSLWVRAKQGTSLGAAVELRRYRATVPVQGAAVTQVELSPLQTGVDVRVTGFRLDGGGQLLALVRGDEPLPTSWKRLFALRAMRSSVRPDGTATFVSVDPGRATLLLLRGFTVERQVIDVRQRTLSVEWSPTEGLFFGP